MRALQARARALPDREDLPHALIPWARRYPVSRLLAGMRPIAQSSRQSAPRFLKRQSKYKKLCVLCGKNGALFPLRPE